MRTPPAHERLVARLIADAEPVRPLWSPRARLVLWLAQQAAPFAFAIRFGLRQDLGAHLREPLFLLDLAALVVAGAVAAGAALRAAVPGMASGRLATFAMLLALATAALVSLEPSSAFRSASSDFVASGVRCVICILAFSTLPWIALFVAVRRGAPLDTAMAGAGAGAAALLFGAAAVRIACPIDEQVHLLTWHTLPIVMGAALSAVAGARWLGRWEASA